jgi:hypothetical protein
MVNAKSAISFLTISLFLHHYPTFLTANSHICLSFLLQAQLYVLKPLLRCILLLISCWIYIFSFKQCLSRRMFRAVLIETYGSVSAWKRQQQAQLDRATLFRAQELREQELLARMHHTTRREKLKDAIFQARNAKWVRLVPCLFSASLLCCSTFSCYYLLERGCARNPWFCYG